MVNNFGCDINFQGNFIGYGILINNIIVQSFDSCIAVNFVGNILMKNNIGYYGIYFKYKYYNVIRFDHDSFNTMVCNIDLWGSIFK